MGGGKLGEPLGSLLFSIYNLFVTFSTTNLFYTWSFLLRSNLIPFPFGVL